MEHEAQSYGREQGARKLRLWCHAAQLTLSSGTQTWQPFYLFSKSQIPDQSAPYFLLSAPTGAPKSRPLWHSVLNPLPNPADPIPNPRVPADEHSCHCAQLLSGLPEQCRARLASLQNLSVLNLSSRIQKQSKTKTYPLWAEQVASLPASCLTWHQWLVPH